MTIVIPEGFANCTMITTVAGRTRPLTTSIGVLPQPGFPKDATEIADSVYAVCTGSGKPWDNGRMIDDFTFQGVSVTQTVGGLPVIGQHIEPSVGTAVSASMPVNCSVLVKKNTALGGRKNRGRCYVGPFNLGEGTVDQIGIIDPSQVTTLGLEWDDFLIGIHDQDLLAILFHSDATTPTEITSFSVESQIATQRRRLR